MIFRDNNFAVIDTIGGTIGFSAGPGIVVTRIVATHGGIISGNGSRFDRVVFGGVTRLHNLSGIGNFTDVSSGDTGRVNKGSTSPGSSGVNFEWEAGIAASSGDVTYSSSGVGNAGVTLIIDYDVVPERSSAMLLGVCALCRYRRRG